MNPRRFLSFLALAIAWLVPSAARADEACEAAAPLDGQRFLRRLSLDLRGMTPSLAEIEAQRAKSDVDEATVDGFLASDAFRETMLKYHRSLLWPNIDQIDLVGFVNMLYPYELSPGETVYMTAGRAVFFRAVGQGNIFMPCKYEPARFDANGAPIMDPYTVGGEVVAYQEGYVEVEPYWAPGTQVKVCALDAQEAAMAPACTGPGERFPFIEPFCQQLQAYADYVQAPFRNADVRCDGRLGQLAQGCGCGPNLRGCQTIETAAQIKKSLLDQMLKITDTVVSTGRPYHEILTTKRIEFNGPVAHYLRYQSQLNFDLYTDPDATAAPPPNLRYDEIGRWVAIDRGGRHAGILTTPGYMLRFQTLRGRAHRFYNAFECSSFIPAGPLPSPFEPCSQHEDLTKRCGCDACHKALEPMAASWGRFAEYGFTHLDDTNFPKRIGANCTPPINDLERAFGCFRFYELDPVGEEMPYQGNLNSYVFRTDEQQLDIEAGPTALVQRGIASGSLARCTVRKMWGQFMRREPTVEEETDVIPGLVEAYQAHGNDVKALVKEIVLHAAYRRQP